MKKYLLILFVLVTAVYENAQAQKSFTIINYSVGIPASNLQDYVDKVSWRGMSIEYHNLLFENLSIGFTGGFNAFYQKKPYDTYTEGTVSLSGKHYRYSNNYPILFTTNYYTDPNAPIVPYVGLGIGTVYSEHKTEFGLYTAKTDAWQFALQPEVGIAFKFTQFMGITLSGKYMQAFNTNDLDGQSYFTLNFGILSYMGNF